MIKKIISWFHNLFHRNILNNYKQKFGDITYHDRVKEYKYSNTFEVEIDGKKWWYVDGYYRNRPEDRKLKVGDAIVYSRDDKFKEVGIIIINSFDFPGDTAARALIGSLPHYNESYGIITYTYTYYSDFAPGFSYYRMATREEMKDFFETYKRNNPKIYNHFLEKMKSFNNPVYFDLI